MTQQEIIDKHLVQVIRQEIERKINVGYKGISNLREFIYSTDNVEELEDMREGIKLYEAEIKQLETELKELSK